MFRWKSDYLGILNSVYISTIDCFLTVKFQKIWPSKFQAGSLQPRVLISRKEHVTRMIWQAEVIAHSN